MDKETSEITKLTERISKDPKSKLFVPLAEEYKKAGDLEMAIYVLTEGLKNNPGYVTARSILGRLLLERGDLSGSQKELEEVVKNIPDNLLAQRKLGDICILKGKPAEALKHYKSVIALNARDNEIASMISDIEAGRDVRSRITQPKLQTDREKALRPDPKPQPSTSTVQPKPTTPEGASTKDSVSRTEDKATALKPPDTPTVTASVASKNEEPEEILIVEPLEKEAPEQQSNEKVSSYKSETDNSQQVVPFGKEPAKNPVVSTSGDAIQPSGVIAEQEIAKGLGLEEAPQENAKQEPSEKSDDFTTDTLAELYIAQGFYEKAIDIYVRMLADNPGSQGLKDKLDRVKAMAAGPPASASEEIEKGASDIFAEPEVYSAHQKPPPDNKASDFFDELAKETTAVKAKEWPTAGMDEADKFVPPVEREFAKSKPIYTDFEPREYTPPQTESPEVQTEVPEEQAHVAPKSSAANRIETIHRLESWLKNIKKEK
ncbi:MAG TPA: tetratricopeptide repeat protein [Nitrospirota bacterium]|nr:tetratricopeptide repeat protein [Nitrospirota bacterium]